MQVYGIDDRFWTFHGSPLRSGDAPDSSPPTSRDILLSPALARDLGAAAGGTVLLRLQRPSAIPLESLHGQKDDSGRTVSAIAKHIRRLKPASLRLAALLDRPARREVEVKIDFTGFVIPDRFVIGYGLDYAGLYRELPGIYTLN